MKLQSKKTAAGKSIAWVFSVALLLVCFGCEPPAPVNNTTATATNVNENAAPVNSAPVNSSNVAAAPNKESQAGMPVTLPVLDAMFTEEDFVGELKSKAQLSDEQIQNLKKLSREAVGNLDEGKSGESGGSTRAAMERADKEIRAMLGEEKTSKLFDVVRQRWAQGIDEADNSSGNSSDKTAKANAIPTDTRIVVNAPAYRMDIFQTGKLVKSYKIGIGYPEFPLPSGMRKADTIIFNPTWTPPDEAWVKGKIEAGKTVAAGDKLNPLGPIKIPIGSPSLIHGGKQVAKLGGFASHGCVGLTNPQVQDFAFELGKISGLSLTAADIKNYEKQKTETKNVKLDKAVPVELRYETIVVENGKLKIFRDVYERGTNTEENLRRVFDGYGVSFDSLNEAQRTKIFAGLKQMAFDAEGQPVDAENNQPNNGDMKSGTNANSKTPVANSKTKGGSNSKDAGADDGKVTRSIKGKKEVSFDIAELKGKGYPSPIGMTQ